jgi:hypothetical protein
MDAHLHTKSLHKASYLIYVMQAAGIPVQQGTRSGVRESTF